MFCVSAFQYAAILPGWYFGVYRKVHDWWDLLNATLVLFSSSLWHSFIVSFGVANSNLVELTVCNEAGAKRAIINKMRTKTEMEKWATALTLASATKVSKPPSLPYSRIEKKCHNRKIITISGFFMVWTWNVNCSAWDGCFKGTNWIAYKSTGNTAHLRSICALYSDASNATPLDSAVCFRQPLILLLLHLFCFSHFYEYKRVCTEFRRYIYMKNHDIQYTKNRTKYLMVSLLFFYLWFEKRQTCAQALAQFFFLSSVCFGKCASFFITSCTILPCIMNFLGAFLLSFRSFGAPDLFFFQFTRFFLF